MIKIKQVLNKADMKKFVNFPLNLYKDCEYYCPPIYGDEMALINKTNANYEENDAVYYLAYKDDVLVGRVAGILNKPSNLKTGKKQIRVNRIDFVDDYEVSKALFDRVETWGKSLGMDEVIGPMGFNDLDREGLLIEGFDQMSCFEENYTFEYYPKHFEKCGYGKDVDWLEYKIFLPKEPDERMRRISNLTKKKYQIESVKTKSTSQLLKLYADQIFDVLDKCYSELYGVVPYTDRVKKQVLAQFKLIVNKDFVSVVTHNNQVIGFGLIFPSIAKAMRDSKGKIVTRHLFKLLKAIKRPEVVDLALIACLPEWRNKGVTAIIMDEIMTNLTKYKVEYAESLLELENNHAVQNQWSNFEKEQHKRRRSYIKHLDVK